MNKKVACVFLILIFFNGVKAMDEGCRVDVTKSSVLLPRPLISLLGNSFVRSICNRITSRLANGYVVVEGNVNGYLTPINITMESDCPVAQILGVSLSSSENGKIYLQVPNEQGITFDHGVGADISRLLASGCQKRSIVLRHNYHGNKDYKYELSLYQARKAIFLGAAETIRKEEGLSFIDKLNVDAHFKGINISKDNNSGVLFFKRNYDTVEIKPTMLIGLKRLADLYKEYDKTLFAIAFTSRSNDCDSQRINISLSIENIIQHYNNLSYCRYFYCQIIRHRIKVLGILAIVGWLYYWYKNK